MIATPPTPKALIDHALSQLNTLATLPEITSQIIATVEDPRSSAAQLHKIVSHDPVLVSRVLKVVNSAFYGLPGQVSSVDRAIVLLGLNAVKNIALAASLGQLFRGAKLCEGYSAKDLWKHCLSVAVIAKELAKRTRKAFVEEAFLSGMVHDLGLLVTLQTWPEKLNRVCDEVKQSSRSFVEVERDVIGADHQQLGEALAVRWKFPPGCAVVAGHHHDAVVAEIETAPLTAAIAIADTLCCHAGLGFPLTALHQILSDDLLEAAGVDRATIDGMVIELPMIVDNASALVG